MLVSTIILVVVRLLSVQWLIQGLVLLASTFVDMSRVPESSLKLLYLLPPALSILVAFAAWALAPTLARLVPGKQDSSVVIPVLSLGDLYAFAFIFLGLYFTLSSLADALNWFHYALKVSLAHDLDPEQKTSLYQLSRPLITLVSGLLCVFRGRCWADKLSKNEVQV